MRTLLLTAIILLGGCATFEDIGHQLWLIDSAEGTYISRNERGVRLVLLDSGVAEVYINAEKEEVAKWEK